jgi:uncharacterized HAD superfamily protein
MRIGIDIDGTLADFQENLLLHHNQKNGTSFQKKDITMYDMTTLFGWKKEEATKKFNEFYQTPLFQDLPIIDGAKEAIEKLSQKHELVIVTARPPELEEMTEKWLDENFGELFSEYIITTTYQKRGKHIPKAKICMDKKISCMIEDSLHFSFECAALGIRVFLLDRPWNQYPALPTHVERLYSWNEVVEKLE